MKRDYCSPSLQIEELSSPDILCFSQELEGAGDEIEF